MCCIWCRVGLTCVEGNRRTSWKQAGKSCISAASASLFFGVQSFTRTALLGSTPLMSMASGPFCFLACLDPRVLLPNHSSTSPSSSTSANMSNPHNAER